MDRNELFDCFFNFSQEVIFPQFEDENALALYSKGGWEGWAQVEIARYLLKNAVEVDREKNVEGARIDLHINDEWYVELKCQSIENSERLLPGVAKDIVKLDSIEGANKAVVFWALGEIGTDEEVAAMLHDLVFSINESNWDPSELHSLFISSWAKLFIVYLGTANEG